MADEGERMPVRLVKENGDVISLDATSVDIVVERIQSNFGLPLAHATKMGIDLNQAAVSIEVQGVFTEDTGQEVSSKATADIDFNQPQQLMPAAAGTLIGGGGGNTGPQTPSGFNQTGFGGVSTGDTGLGSVGAGGGGFSGGFGGSLGSFPTTIDDLGNRILKNWHEKHIRLPVAYWVEEAVKLDNPISSGLQLWLKAETLSSTHSPGDDVTVWTDSAASRNAVQRTSPSTPAPKYQEGGAGHVIDGPYVEFDGTQALEIPFSAFHNSEEFTFFAVVHHSGSASSDIPIVSTYNGSTGGGDAEGFAVDINRISNEVKISYQQSSSKNTFTTSTSNSVAPSRAHIISFTMDDTDADAQSDTVNVMLNGEPSGGSAQHTISSPSSAGYAPNTAANMLIGDASPRFNGGMYEIILYNRVLSETERQQVEGYLGRKYGLYLDFTHSFRGIDYSYDNKHITIGFDKDLVTSRAEPYGFSNRRRDTGLTFNSAVDDNTFAVSGGDPRDWFEVSENDRNIPIIIFDHTTNRPKVDSGNLVVGSVTAVTASQITVNWTGNVSTSSLASGNKVYMDTILYNNSKLEGNLTTPAYILPIKNADTFTESAIVNKAVGPEFPNFENGDARTTAHGTDLTRTDEYIAFMLSKMLTGGVRVTDSSEYLDTGYRVVDSLNSTSLSSVFDVEIIQGGNGHNSRLRFTQKYASSLGQLSDVIDTNLGIGQMPYIEGFSGGRSGKRVKSGGDKVQDILGILGNSANFLEIPDQNFITTILGFGVGFIQNEVYENSAAQGDFIRGIQIPYNSLATKGKSVLDAEVAQRNFFLTTDDVSTDEKLSTANTIHASGLFSHYHNGHLKNGIGGLVTDFNVHQDAEMKAYEFSLKFAAADIIL